MQSRLVGKVSQRLRALIKGGDDWGVADESDIPTLGLMERVRDEWQSRQLSRGEARFGLPDLLRALQRAQTSEARINAHPEFERRPERLPEHRLRRDGRADRMDAEFFARRRYAIEELTDFADAIFVEIAYRCILKREPDPVGFTGFLRPLREGLRDRVDIVRALSASPEGGAQQVRITGLRRVAFWRLAERTRFIGPTVGWLHAVTSAGRLAQRLQVVEARAEAGHQHHVMLLQSIVGKDLLKINESISSLERSQVQVETAVLGLTNRYRRFLLEVQLNDVVRGPRDKGEPDDTGEEIARAHVRIERLESAIRTERNRLVAISTAIENSRVGGTST